MFGGWFLGFLERFLGILLFLLLLNLERLGFLWGFCVFCGVFMFLGSNLHENMFKTRELDLKIMLFRKPTKLGGY